MGWARGRGVDVGVDFEEETVEDEMVIAPLPVEGGMRGFGPGVVAVEVVGTVEGCVWGAGGFGIEVMDGERSDALGGCCVVDEGMVLSCCCCWVGRCGFATTMTSSWTGFRISST